MSSGFQHRRRRWLSVVTIVLALVDQGARLSEGAPRSTTIIERAQARKIAVLLCQMEAPPVNGFSYTVEFHRLFPRLAERYDLPLVPFFLYGVAGDPS
jgi:hypothetical protein